MEISLKRAPGCFIFERMFREAGDWQGKLLCGAIPQIAKSPAGM
ncbi:hypothetical protein MEBOL_003227 [Melittangium boletus DSM 14713]|uniref:Uncharacterized protein n=1 Tax=Melittangium boletus DSM 14713 TaxID=1294270 RepID=A0A250IF38_9BACT|nr:hypothetical protein MEBOL_003227 [Melittangium boletus DSM 14713]